MGIVLNCLNLLIILVCVHCVAGQKKKYNFDKKVKSRINYHCIAVEVKCIYTQMFLLEAITGYSLGYISRYEFKQACKDLRQGEVCIKDTGCLKELDGKIKLMKWMCKNRRGLFSGTKCWRSSQFMKNAPVCDLKIKKGCHFHKLLGTCLKSVIGKNKQCHPKQMHFYGGMLEAIDRFKNPNGRCNNGYQGYAFY